MGTTESAARQKGHAGRGGRQSPGSMHPLCSEHRPHPPPAHCTPGGWPSPRRLLSTGTERFAHCFSVAELPSKRAQPSLRPHSAGRETRGSKVSFCSKRWSPSASGSLLWPMQDHRRACTLLVPQQKDWAPPHWGQTEQWAGQVSYEHRLHLKQGTVSRTRRQVQHRL